MTVSASQDIRVQTISVAGMQAALTGTPLAPWTDVFVQLADQYQIDRNWIISYMLWETGLGAAGPNGRHPSMDFNDPWDILCGTPDTACSGYWAGAVCTRAPNSYCYQAFPTMPAGIEAGYQNWAHYVQLGYTTWFATLSRALCGNAAGCAGTTWVQSVITQGQQNEARWPVSQVPQCDPTCCKQSTTCTPCAGAPDCPIPHPVPICDPSCCQQATNCIPCVDSPNCPTTTTGASPVLVFGAILMMAGAAVLLSRGGS